MLDKVREGGSIQRLTVIGVGLIGGSLAGALRRGGLVEEVVGIDTVAERLSLAQERGLIDWGTNDVSRGVEGAGLVVIAVPVGSTASVLEEVRESLDPTAVVTDVGSVKACIEGQARRILGAESPFVGGHPIAGTEDSGVEAAFPELFEGALCVLTPTESTPRYAVERVQWMWKKIAGYVAFMQPEEHDRILAVTSHLPHMLAYSLVNTFGTLPEQDRLSPFAAGGFRDLTRIAASDTVMWRDIALNNAPFLLDILACYEVQLHNLRTALENRDAQAVEAFLQRGRDLRRALPSDPGPQEGVSANGPFKS